jgi:tetratricopeptide (TPR) repeat protein
VTRLIGVAVFLCAAGALQADALREAAEALETNDYDGAIPHLEAALKEDPGNVNARFNLAYALQSTGDDDSAIRHYRMVVAHQPDLVHARQNLVTLLMRAGRFAEAAEEYEALGRLRPAGAPDLLLLAAAHREAGDAESAAEAYRRALDLESSSLDALVGLANALSDLGRLHESVPYYMQAAAIDAKFEGALLGIAERLERAGAKQDALELYRRYARSRPNDAAVQEQIGILLLEDGNLRAAVQALERAVSVAPGSERHAALAEAYRRAGDSDSAREQLRLAARASPEGAEARVRYANSLLQVQEYERAAREYLGACEADAGNRDAWNGLAFALFQLGNFPGSLRALRESESLGPPQAASVYLKALSLDKLQQYEQARAAYRAFLSLDSGMQDERWKAEQRLKAIQKVLAKR